jgi:HSP20 family protein
MKLTVQATQDEPLSAMAKRLGKWMDQVLGPSYHNYLPGEVWRPAINICEHDDHYCVVVELPGMKADQIDLNVQQGLLHLAGRRAMPRAGEVSKDNPVRVHLMEIDHGHFERALELPSDVEVDRIEAAYRGGFLWIELPKKKV